GCRVTRRGISRRALQVVQGRVQSAPEQGGFVGLPSPLAGCRPADDICCSAVTLCWRAFGAEGTDPRARNCPVAEDPTPSFRKLMTRTLAPLRRGFLLEPIPPGCGKASANTRTCEILKPRFGGGFSSPNIGNHAPRSGFA